jgi:plastocyanin domain-containing protein
MDKIFVSVGGLGLIVFIYWFFFGKKEDKDDDGSTNTARNKIIVAGGYSPSTLYVEKDKPKTFIFIRTDQNNCLEEVIFPDYKIKKYLPLNEEVEITLKPPHHAGSFHCGMNMFFGEVKIK